MNTLAAKAEAEVREIHGPCGSLDSFKFFSTIIKNEFNELEEKVNEKYKLTDNDKKLLKSALKYGCIDNAEYDRLLREK